MQATQGRDLALSADITGEMMDLRSWSGNFDLQTEGLQPQGWLRTWLAPDAQIGAENLNVAIEGSLADGRLLRMLVDVEADAIVAARAGYSSGGADLRASAVLEGQPKGWQLDLRELHLGDEEIARGRLRSMRGAHDREWDIDIDRLRLAPLAFWFGIWQPAPDWTQLAARAGGELEGVVLRLRPQADSLQYSLRARARNLSMEADQHFGFAGVNGELSADQNGGRLQLSDDPLQLSLPQTFLQPVAIDSLNGLWQWQRLAAGWRLYTTNLALRLESLAANGKVELRTSEADESPLLDVALELSAGDLNDAKPLMPQRWSPQLRDWLQRGIVAGRASGAQLRIQGPAADFPYHRRATGAWTLDLDVNDVTLDYAPDWPPLNDLTAQLHFADNGLDAKVLSGNAKGSRIRSARARFVDFDDHLLQVDAVIDGPLARQYAFLRESPLHKPLAGLVDGTRASGSSRVDFHLEVPLRDVNATEAAGHVSLDNAELLIGKLDTPVSDIKGVLAFTHHGVTSDQLTARFAEVPLNLRVEAQAGTHGVVRGQFDFEPRADGQGASRYIPALVRDRLSGQSAWKLELPIEDATSALVLRSELQGMAVDLPQPLTKAAAAAVPLRLRIGADSKAPLRLNLDYAGQFGLDLILGQTPEDEAASSVLGLHARLGGQAPHAVVGRKLLDGHLQAMDLMQLAALVSGEGSGLQLDQADLEVDQLRWRSFVSGPTRLRYTPNPAGWRVQLDGKQARGQLDWLREGNALSARLEQLALRVTEPDATVAGADAAVADEAIAAAEAPEQPAPPLDPAQWPQLNLDCALLQLDGSSLGHLQLQTARIPGGQRISKLNLAGGLVTLDASGQWRRAEQRSTATLHFDLASTDIGALLKALQYTPNLEAERSRFVGELNWSPAAAGLDWEQAQGHIAIDIADGQLRAVQPGMGRVLGLVNFYALPRRLTLNFDDVVSRGLGFDHIKGGFDLAAGVAQTEDLSIEAPSLRMEVRGRVGLTARDYDQRVTVYPDVSAGVTLGAALIGGPAVGALVLLAQELLDKPLDQATQLTYRVSGSWDNPVVVRADGTAPTPAVAAPPTAPSANLPAAPATSPTPVKPRVH